ncbi:hypothetical protein BpHYR1_019320, partial [Brachionus plicatilis]
MNIKKKSSNVLSIIEISLAQIFKLVIELYSTANNLMSYLQTSARHSIRIDITFPQISLYHFVEKKILRSTNFLAFRIYSINLNISGLKNVSTIVLDSYFFDQYPEVSYNSVMIDLIELAPPRIFEIRSNYPENIKEDNLKLFYSTDLFLWFYQNLREFTKILVNLPEF